MNCREFETEWAAGEDTSRLPAAMQEHCRACPHCAALMEDVTSILRKAGELGLEAEPPERVWVAIRNQLEQEGIIREPVMAVAKVGWRPASASGWPFRLPMSLACAAVFLVAAGVMYLHSPYTNPAVPPFGGTPQVPEMAWVRPNTGDSNRSVESLIARVPEEHRATFVSNWNQVNSSIDSLQSFVEMHPDDPFAPQQLLNAFQQRERLRETLVGRDESQ